MKNDKQKFAEAYIKLCQKHQLFFLGFTEGLAIGNINDSYYKKHEYFEKSINEMRTSSGEQVFDEDIFDLKVVDNIEKVYRARIDCKAGPGKARLFTCLELVER